MVPQTSNRWKPDREYIELLNFLIERTENVESPMCIKRLAREFKEKSGVALTVKCLQHRIGRIGAIIPSFEAIDTRTKVKILFSLGASVNPEFLKELKKDALVEVDEKIRITYYKANDGRLELRGDHSRSAKSRTGLLESKRSLQSWIINYFETKDDADAVPKNQKEKEMGDLIKFITEKCDNVDSPLRINRLAEDFVGKFRASMPSQTVRSRIERYGLEIQRMEFVDTRSKVQQVFGLSATVNSDCLERLRKNALVEVDEKNRIVFYKANDGSLELRGDHSQSAKTTTSYLESKRTHQKLIRDYFEKKNNSDAVLENEEEKEMWNLIEFITDKCENVNSPLNVTRLAEDFINHFVIPVHTETIRRRIKSYCREIQKRELLDTQTKIKQLYSLSATMNSDYLEKLRTDAHVEVDKKNRISYYKAKNGDLELSGNHSQSAKNELRSWNVRRKSKKTVKKHCSSGGDEDEDSEKENGYSEEDNDEYSSEESDSEFDSDDENNPLDETQDLTNPSNEAVDFHNKTPDRTRSQTGISIDDNLDFDPPTEMSEDQENNSGIMGSTSVKTRYGRLSKRRHLDAECSYNLARSRSTGASMNTDSASSKPAKQKKIAIQKEQASILSNQSRNVSLPSFSIESGENNIMENQDAPRAYENPSDYHRPPLLEKPELLSADKQRAKINAQDTHSRSDAVASELHPEKESLSLQNETNSTTQTNGEEVISQEVPIKVENGEPITVENHPEDVKPVTAHNPKIKFFEAMYSLILFLDTPSLSNLQSKIHQKIRKLKGSKEVLQNNELIPALELLVARMTNHSVLDISKSVKSVNLIQFFCYLKASILNSKLSDVEGLMNNITGLIEKSQNKRIPMEKVANALHATLDIDSF